MSEEIARVLKLLEDGKITADQAEDLINAITKATKSQDQWIDLNETPDSRGMDSDSAPAAPGKKPSWLYVMVDSMEGGRKNVRVRIPVKMARWALKFIPKSAQTQIKEKHGEEIDLAALAEMIDELPVGEDIVNVIDEEKGERVRIFLR
jgi:hypothetical protein